MDTSKKEIVIKKANDHWAFLEHIEAPMWVDLTLEAKSGAEEDTNDDWFSISHLFHKWSSHQLKSKFSHPGEEIVTSELDSQEPPSPQLPSSVSRSRGKHYKSKKWGGNNLVNLFDKQPPTRGLSGRFFQRGSNYGREVKSKSNVIMSKGMSSAKLRLGFERNASGNALSKCTKSMATGRSPVISSNSADNKTGGSNSRSTITSEYTQQQTKFMDISSQPYDQKNQPSFKNTSLKKSCVVKKVSRGCELSSGKSSGGDSRQSRGCASSSGKSSVGSCSNPSYEVKYASKQRREKISDRKDVATEALAAKNRCKPSNISRKSTVQVEELKFGDRKETTSNFGKPAYHKAAKSLVQKHTVRSRALAPANKQNSSTSAKEKQENGKLNGLAGSKRIENAARNAATRQNIIERGVPTRCLFVDQRTMECNTLQNGDTAGSAALKGKVTREAKNTTNLTRRIYFR